MFFSPQPVAKLPNKKIMHLSRVNQIARMSDESPLHGIYTDAIDTCIVVAILVKGKALSFTHDFGFNSIDYFQGELDYIQSKGGSDDNIKLYLAYNNPFDMHRLKRYQELFSKQFPNALIQRCPTKYFFTVLLSGEYFTNMPQMEGYQIETNPNQEVCDLWCDNHAYAGVPSAFLMTYFDGWLENVPVYATVLEKLINLPLGQITKEVILQQFTTSFPDPGFVAAIKHKFDYPGDESAKNMIAELMLPYLQQYCLFILNQLSPQEITEACCKDETTALVVLDTLLHKPLEISQYNLSKIANAHSKAYDFIHEKCPEIFKQIRHQSYISFLFRIERYSEILVSDTGKNESSTQTMGCFR